MSPHVRQGAFLTDRLTAIRKPKRREGTQRPPRAAGEHEERRDRVERRERCVQKLCWLRREKPWGECERL